MLRIALISLALIAGATAASARTATLSKNVFACMEWAGWHEYTLASLTPQGARANKYCPIRINAGAKVEVTDESDTAGSATVQYKGKRLGDRRRRRAVTGRPPPGRSRASDPAPA